MPSHQAGRQAPARDEAAKPARQAPRQPPVSRRVLATSPPVIAKTKAIISASGRDDVASLAQGVVFWPPPPAARQAALTLAEAAAAGAGPAAAALSSYGPTPGLPLLRDALRRRLRLEYGLPGYEPVVTPGGNAAFSIALLALCDAEDGVALFPPVYFNERMSVQVGGPWPKGPKAQTKPLPPQKPTLLRLRFRRTASVGGGISRVARFPPTAAPQTPRGR
jgi:DNA-binding transcriptional MocR family regulator